MAEEEIGREAAAMWRTTLQVAALLAEHWYRRTEARAREAQTRHDDAVRATAGRLDAERKMAETSLRVTNTPGWWDSADRPDIAEAWCTARQWRDQSPVAAATEQHLTTEIRQRYGVDLSTKVAVDDPANPMIIGQLLDRAAWHQAATRLDDTKAATALDAEATRQRVAAEALYALVTAHANAATDYIHSTPGDELDKRVTAEIDLGIAEAGLRALGEDGRAWLHDHAHDPRRAYARVLVGPDRASRLELHDAVQLLHASVDTEPVFGGETERAETIAAALSAVAETGEPGRLWLEAWHVDPDAAYHRIHTDPVIGDDLTARTTATRDAQRRAAETELRTTTGKWWNTASRSDIAHAWTTAHQWSDESTVAEKAAERITNEIRRRYGLDITETFDTETELPEQDAVRDALDRAAWQQAAAKLDTAAIEATRQETLAIQRAERDAFYEAVVDHRHATNQYLTHNDHRPAAGNSTAARQQRAQAIGDAEARISDLGTHGKTWLREFERDPRRAYAATLVGPDRTSRTRLHDAVRQLRDTTQIDVASNQDPAGVQQQRDDAIAAIGSLGEPGERWLEAWRHDPDIAYIRVLDDTVTIEELRTPEPTPKHVKAATAAHERSRPGDRRNKKTRQRARLKEVDRGELVDARTWLSTHDLDWLDLRDYKLSIMRADDHSSRRSVEQAIVERHKDATSPDPAIREQARLAGIADHNDREHIQTIQTRMREGGVDPDVQEIRMMLHEDYAIPLHAVLTGPLAKPSLTSTHDLTMDLEPEVQRDLGLEL